MARLADVPPAIGEVEMPDFSHPPQGTGQDDQTNVASVAREDWRSGPCVAKTWTMESLRIIVGVILGILAILHIGGSIGTWIFGILAVIALVTGISGVCGVYRLLGIRTCPLPVRDKQQGPS